jgi:hypothetical protein
LESSYFAPRLSRPTCFLHVGTHKTGTTSVQNFLMVNDGILADAGLYVPRAGRAETMGGHHNLAWELNEDSRFDAAHGSFADVLDEIARKRAPRVCLTSEDFEYVHARPRALATVADGLRAIGYQALVVVYLRPQADYAESLYGELVRHGLADPFETFLATIIANGEFRFSERWCFAFDYERLLDNFAQIFGLRSIIARRYEGSAGDVVADFLQVVGGGAPAIQRRISATPRLHAGLRFGEVLRRLESNVGSCDWSAPAPVRGGADLCGRFDPVHVSEVRRIVARFNLGNRRISDKYGVQIPCVSGGDLVRDVAAALGVDPASSYRKRLVEAHAQTRGSAGGAPRVSQSASAQPMSAEPTSPPLFSAELARPALFEAAIFATAALVALASFLFGWRTASTALVEFAMLSTIVAASAVAVLGRYAVESRGIVADDRYFDEVGVRLSLLGYSAVGAYALINAVLDVGLPRHAPDWISYPGTVATAAAILILTLILPARRRLHDRLYLAGSYVILLFELAHAVSPVWWLDTTVDVFVLGLAGFTAYQILLHRDRASGVVASAGAYASAGA